MTDGMHRADFGVCRNVGGRRETVSQLSSCDLRHRGLGLPFDRSDVLGPLIAVGESFVLINNRDPKHPREQFEIDHPTVSGRERSRWWTLFEQVATLAVVGVA